MDPIEFVAPTAAETARVRVAIDHHRNKLNGRDFLRCLNEQAQFPNDDFCDVDTARTSAGWGMPLV